MIYQTKNSVGAFCFECIRYENFFFVPHMHRHPELIFVREGSTTVILEGVPTEVHAGEMALILPNRLHAYETRERSVVDVVIFSEDHVPQIFRDLKGREPVFRGFTCSAPVTEFAANVLFRESQTPSLYSLKGALYAVLGEYLAEAQFRPVPAGNEELTDRITRYVSENFTDNISLATMADALGYNRHYLSRYFHAHFHMNFSRYVNWYRVDMANALLAGSQLSVTEIALQSGFQSIRSFNRVYLELVGRTPTENP